MDQFRVLITACFGVMVGVVIAMALAHGLFPMDRAATSPPAGLLAEAWVVQSVRVEPREKGFFLVALLLGSIGGYVALGRLVVGRMPVFALAGLLIAAIPLVNEYAARSLQGDMSSWIGLAAAVVAIVAYRAVLRRHGSTAGIPNVMATTDMRLARPWVYPLLLLPLTLILFPSSFETVAARIGIHEPYVSFIIGPALYFLGQGLLPGVDYYTQYGIGLGWVFSFFFGDTTRSTMIHFVIFVVVASWLFYAQLIAMLGWLYRSWLAAATVAFGSLILLFHSDAHFIDPSSTILRYPLLVTSAALFAYWVTKPDAWLRVVLLATAIASSLFLETETGVITALSVSIAYVVVSPRVATLLRLVILGGASLVALLLILVSVFGLHVLSVEFLLGWIEPLVIYGVGGFGGVGIAWVLREWNWLYNFVAPGLALATLAMLARSTWDGATDRPRAALLAFFATSGLLMMAKFINMSIVAVWQMNALGFLVVLGWWATQLARALPAAAEIGRRTYPLRALATAGLVFASATIVATADDTRIPTLYGLRSWLQFPSLARAPFTTVAGCTEMACVADLPDRRDVELIRDRTAPGEQVAIVGDLKNDWTYLIDAKRAPLMLFLPQFAIFTEHQLKGSLARLDAANYWFIPVGADGEPAIANKDFKAALLPLLKRDFVADGVGAKLGAWKRRTPSGPPPRQ